MSLPDVVSTGTHTALTLTWTRKVQRKPVDLTGATITGRMVRIDVLPNVTRDITGTFTIVTATSGIFSWTFSAADIATPGTWEVQFIATYGDGSKELSYKETLTILPAI